MKTISLRKFRETIADLTELTTVVRRDPDTGDYTVLGVWTPGGSAFARDLAEWKDDPEFRVAYETALSEIRRGETPSG